MIPRTSFVVLALAAAACSEPEHAPHQHASEHRLYWHDGLAFGFEVPATWVEHQEGDALVFSGTRDTTAYFTTLVLQVVSNERTDDQDLKTVLEEIVGPTMARHPFSWIEQSPDLIAGRPAARYVFEVELHESLRRKQGLIIDIGDHLVDLSYAATPELYSAGIPIFEHARATFRLENDPRSRE